MRQESWMNAFVRAGLLPESRLVFTKNDYVPGFRLSPKCSPICYGLVIPRGRFFIGIMNDKGRYHFLIAPPCHSASMFDTSPKPTCESSRFWHIYARAFFDRCEPVGMYDE